MKKLILLLFIFVLLAGCAGKKKSIETPSKSGKVQTLQVPAWFLEPPEGNYVLGLSKLSIENLEMKTAAFQHGVVQYCRNQSSYIVNKKAMRESEYKFVPGSAGYQIIVNSNPDLLKSVSEKLELLDSFWFFDNYIGLYGMNASSFNNSKVSISFSESFDNKKPEWFKSGLHKKGSQIFVNVRADSYSLDYAWQKAYDAARVKLAAYLETDVSSTVYHINEKEDKLIALETTKKMGRISLNRCYAKRYIGSGGPGYCVFLQIGMEL